MPEIVNGNGNHIYDIPSPTPTSIGETSYYPKPASENRKKNIYPDVIEKPQDLLGFFAEFQSLPFSPDVTRYSTRIFTTGSILKGLTSSDKKNIEPFIEGVIPLEGCNVPQLDDCALIYLGKNAPERLPTENIVEGELSKAAEIFSRPYMNYQRPLTPEYSIKLLTAEERLNPEVQAQYAELYSAFNYGPEDVAKMLLNPNNIIIALFDGNIIVSTGMIEHAKLELKRGSQSFSFFIGEVTEGFTREEANGKIYRGKGLYTHVISELMKQEAGNGINLIYAESNADASIPYAQPPVLISAQRQGRFSTIASTTDYGFKPNLLRRHVHITNDANDMRPQSIQNDLLVTYMVRSRLLEIYGK